MIDYGIIDASIKHYEKCGYTRVETPWTVTKAVSDITRPPEAKEMSLKHEDGKVLVASGEQSFLYQYLKGFLPKGKFQTVTPCFRHDPFDSLHTKYFIKNELIVTDFNPIDAASVLESVVRDAFIFFKDFFPNYLPEVQPLKIKETGLRQFDILFDNVELGSYGIRRCDFLTWVYGTGCAEPRFTLTRKKYGFTT